MKDIPRQVFQFMLRQGCLKRDGPAVFEPGDLYLLGAIGFRESHPLLWWER